MFGEVREVDSLEKTVTKTFFKYVNASGKVSNLGYCDRVALLPAPKGSDHHFVLNLTLQKLLLSGL